MNLLNLKLLTLVGLLTFGHVAFGSEAGADQQGASGSSRIGLRNAFLRIEPWPVSRDYSTEDTRKLIEAARLLQLTDEADVESVLQEIVVTPFRLGSNNPSKLFLLLRVAFDLPENAREDDGASLNSWGGSKQAFMNGTVNLSWPFKWVGEVPRLQSRYGGYEGPPFDPVGEYRQLRRQYRFRRFKNQQKV